MVMRRARARPEADLAHGCAHGDAQRLGCPAKATARVAASGLCRPLTSAGRGQLVRKAGVTVVDVDGSDGLCFVAVLRAEATDGCAGGGGILVAEAMAALSSKYCSNPAGTKIARILQGASLLSRVAPDSPAAPAPGDTETQLIPDAGQRIRIRHEHDPWRGITGHLRSGIHESGGRLGGYRRGPVPDIDQASSEQPLALTTRAAHPRMDDLPGSARSAKLGCSLQSPGTLGLRRTDRDRGGARYAATGDLDSVPSAGSGNCASVPGTTSSGQSRLPRRSH